jgi:hypothetical protein
VSNVQYTNPPPHIIDTDCCLRTRLNQPSGHQLQIDWRRMVDDLGDGTRIVKVR